LLSSPNGDQARATGSDGPLEVCFVGTHDPGFGRTSIIRHGLQRRGVTVVDWSLPAWGTTAARLEAARRGLLNPGLALRLAQSYGTIAHHIRTARKQPDLYYVPYPAQLDVAFLRTMTPGQPIVCDAFISFDETLADRGIGAPLGATRRVARFLDRLAFQLADRIVVDTTAHLQRFAHELGLVPERGVVVPVGAEDPGPIPPSTSNRRNSPLRVLYFGGFIPLHGVPLIVEAARQLGPDSGIQFDLVGEGQEAGAVERALKDASMSHVRLIRSWTPEAELIAQHVAAADVCLGAFASSPKASDVVPAKVYLALACRRAVLTADTPAIRQEILARTAPGGPPLLTCPAGDPSALAAALGRLRDQTNLRDHIADAGRRTYDACFRPELVVEPLLPIIAQLSS